MTPTARRALAPVLVGATVLSLAGCSNAASVAADGARDQITLFENRLERVLERGQTPESLWQTLDPTNRHEDALLDTAFTSQTAGPFAFSHQADSDTLTLDVYVSVKRTTGGGTSTQTAQRYLCARYVVATEDRTFIRTNTACPEEATPPADPLTDAMDFDL